MSVHYKFKSALDYDTVNFDGLHISVKDLKAAIIQAKRFGKNTDFDLQVTNAQTKEVYENEETLIPKNTSLLIARIPMAAQAKTKAWEGYGGDSTPPTRTDDGGPISKAVDLSSLDASEDDKIRAMMSQSTLEYDPSNYVKIRGANQVGVVPPNYRCYKCHQSGHWIKDCPLSQGPEPMEIKKSTGIPRSFMVPVEGPQVLGAMMTPNGSYAVPLLDHQTYTQQKPAPPPLVEEKPEIPEDLVCSICTDLLADAVMIPCCGNSFCDECIRSTLLESDDHECPDCHERNISPATLIPNRFLRNSVATFKNTTGYVKRPILKISSPVIEEVKIDTKIQKEATPPPPFENSKREVSVESVKADNGEKPIISEADSTQPKKSQNTIDFSEDIDISNLSKDAKSTLSEGPPGVSPKRDLSPRSQKEANKSKSKVSRSQGNGNGERDRHDEKQKSHDRERRRANPKSPTYSPPISHEERAGTPTVDEPGMSTAPANSTYPPNSQGAYTAGPPGVLPPMINMGPPPHMQGPPTTNMAPYPTGQHPAGVFPPTQGPPPNFRLPPPGTGPAPFIQGPYNAPPRPLFDPGRPPIQGPPPYHQNYTGGRNRNREYPPRGGMRGRTPPGLIDDPLEAFNRMLREKDERERRARQRKGRSYSRSSSRSYSRSPRRLRSRSPRRRSRSRSFSMSRSRSRSFSPSPRQSPYREYSPRPLSPRGRRPPSRYRSPARSPPRYRFKDAPITDRNRDRDYDRGDNRDNRNRDYNNQRDERSGFNQREDYRESREGRGGERDYHYYDNFDNRDNRGRPKSQWGQGGMRGSSQDQYYQSEMHQQPQFAPPNRYPPRENFQNYMNKGEQHHMPPIQHPPPQMHSQPPRRYDDVVPPGTEQPPIPGEEPPPRYDDRYSYDRGHQENQNDRDRYSGDREIRHKEIESNRHNERGREDTTDRRSRERRYERYNSRSPSNRNARNPSPRRSRERHDSPDKHKRRRREDSPDKKDDKREIEREKHHKRDYSDDEKYKKSKEKKKKKEKKESERKKRKERKERREEKHKKSEDKERREKSKTKEKDPEDSNDEKESKSRGKHEEKQPKNEDFKTEPNIEETVKENSPKHKTNIKEVKVDKRIANQNLLKNNDWEHDIHEKKEQTEESEPKSDLYDDILSEGVDRNIVQNYGKIEDQNIDNLNSDDIMGKTPEKELVKDQLEEEAPECETSKEYDDVLELHTNEADLKAELDKSEVLAPVPEKSKWELEDETLNSSSQAEIRSEVKNDKSGKVTNEVLKRAENAIFAKAINAIRPIEIKKISLDRAKLYSGEKESKRHEEVDTRNIQVTIPTVTYEIEDDIHPPGTEPLKVEPEPVKPPVRLSVKERLGVKVDDLDRIVRVDRNRSRSMSPFSKRHIEMDERRRYESGRDRHARSYRNPDRGRDSHRDFRRDGYRGRDDGIHRDDRRGDRRDDRKDDRGHSRREMEKREKRKRTPTPSHDHKDKDKKRRDKKQKREKTRKHKREDDEEKEDKSKVEESAKPKPVTDRRKPTLDEANFEPDYDLETESEKEEERKSIKKRSTSKSPDNEAKRVKVEEKKVSSSSDSSDSSSEEERKKRKKHKKHKKKTRRDSTSSSSDSESDSSEDEHKRRKKHKKNKKKRKKSKHK